MPLSARWLSATKCTEAGCVEVKLSPDGTIVVRDSKDPDGPCLRFSPLEWVNFIAGAKTGEFDLA
jgi:hypothetical protein